MKNVIHQLQTSACRMFFVPGVSAEELDRYEQTQGVRLPEDFRQWLMFSNGGELFAPGLVLLGIPAEKWNLATANTPESREEYELPEDLYIIGIQNYGDPICFDHETFEIVQWDHETLEASCAWDSFRDFLEDLIRAES